MTKAEFEELTIKGTGAISAILYNTIERLYVSDNDYHRYHGGVDESKQDFCKRVYGGKVNTIKSIVSKTIDEVIRENRYALLGTQCTEDNLKIMDELIRDNININAGMQY